MDIRSEMDWESEAVKADVGTDYVLDVAVYVLDIMTERGLAWFASCVNAGEDRFEGWTVRLLSDLDLGGREWKPVGVDEKRCFQGIFEGNGHVVKGMKICAGQHIMAGLFGFVSGSDEWCAGIRNLHIREADIVTSCSAGILAGKVCQGIVHNCSSSGKVVAEGNAGGLFCWVKVCQITDCFSSAEVVSEGLDAGGLIVSAENCTVAYCFASGNVRGLTCAGGLCANVYGGLVCGCFASGCVEGAEAPGGLISIVRDVAAVSYCYASGCVTVDSACWENSVGGLIGDGTSLVPGNSCSVSSCYFGGRVKNRAIFSGMLVGSFNGEIESCLYVISADTELPGVGRGDHMSVLGARGISEKKLASGFFPEELAGKTAGEWVVTEGMFPQLHHFVRHGEPEVREVSKHSVQVV